MPLSTVQRSESGVPSAPACGRRSRLSIVVVVGVSAALAAALIAGLAAFGRIDPSEILRLTASVDLRLLALICVLGCAQTFLAAEKWRNATSSGGRVEMSRQTAYAATALGVGLALFMPLQIASSLTRAVGARLSGDATMLRGGAASLFEQAFDVAVYACLMIAALATVQIGGGGGAWAAFALSFLLMAWAGAGRGLVFLRQSLNWTAARLDKTTWLRRVSESISESGFLGPALARRLLLLSVFRYLLLGMMSAAVAPAVGLDIPAWKVMAALPFAALAAAVSPTPSGLGLLDWAFASGLMMFGTPVDIAVQWALVNRLLMSAHSLFVALTGGLCALFVQRSG